MGRFLAVVSVAIGTISCFNPSYDVPACGPSGACPSGLTCNVATSLCVGAGGSDGGGVRDAAPDVLGTECTAAAHAACTGNTPVCSSNDTCRICEVHSECPSDACLPDGACGDDTNVAYVDPSGSASGVTCTREAPCANLTAALATARPYVKFHGTTAQPALLNNVVVTFLADPGAKLTGSGVGPVVTIEGLSTIVIFDLEITGGIGTAGVGVSMPQDGSASSTVALRRVTVDNNAGSGIVADAGTLTMFQSTIIDNNGGGILLTNTSFDLENDMIVENGDSTSTVGGVVIQQVTSGSGSHVLAFDTIVANRTGASANSGVNCAEVLVPLMFSSNIVYANTVSDGGAQTGGTNCAYTYSDLGPDPEPAGTGNINADPMVVSEATNNFHIMSTSPCKDTADPAATLAIDFDGDSRPQGPQRDIGADEYKP